MAPGCRCSHRCAGCGARCSAGTADPFLKAASRAITPSRRGTAVRSLTRPGRSRYAGVLAGAEPSPRDAVNRSPLRPAPSPTRPVAALPTTRRSCCDGWFAVYGARPLAVGSRLVTGRAQVFPALTAARTALPGPPRGDRARRPGSARRPAPEGCRPPGAHPPSAAGRPQSGTSTPRTPTGVRPSRPVR